MKRLLFTFFAIMLLGTSGAWGATERGKFKIDKTIVTIASENNWENNGTIKNSVNLDGYIKYTGVKNNATLQVNNNVATGARVYESINQYGPSTISGTNVWIDSVGFTYTTSTTGVLCSSKDTVGGVVPGTSGTIYNSGDMYKVNAASFSFYSGRTSSKKSNGRCDITNWKVVYYKLPTQIALAESMTVAVGDTFQIGQVTPTDAYYVWSSGDASKIKVDQNGVIIALATTSTPVEIKVVSKNNIERKCNVTVVAGGGKTWQETFSKAELKNSDYTADVVGDSSVYNWTLTRYQRQDAAGYKVDGKIGLYLRYNGKNSGASIASNGNLEGGIKAVAFKWKPASASYEVHFVVNVDGKNYEYYTTGQTSKWYKYQREFGVDKNASFSISLDKQRTPQQGFEYFSPITITPYLLYTKKSVEVYKTEENKGKYTNTDLIDNTGGATPEYSISCGTDIAEIDANGEVTIKKSGTATVTATWGNVSTTYTLIMHAKEAPVITFTDQNVDMNQAPFAPEPTLPATGKVGTPSFSSTDKSVVKVNATTGELTIVGQGVATINVHYTEGEDWASTDVSYKVTVTDPMEDAVTETFTTAKVTSKAALDTIHGTIADWQIKYIRRDITQVTRPDTLRCGQRASRLQNIDPTKSPESYLITTKPLEGGIKRVSFLWNNGSPFLSRDHNFIVIAGSDKDTIIKTVTVPDKDIALATKDIIYNHNFGITENVTLSIRNNSGCYALIGNVKVTPYLLYTKKNAEAYKTENGGKYTNIDLINNTGATPSYSISCGTDTAEINPSTGEVTIKKSAVVTVTASWSNVSTTYQLTMHGNPAPTVTFADQEVDMYHAAYTPEPTEIPSSGMGDASYSSDDKNVVRVNATSGELTIVGEGVANINVHYEEGTEWAAKDVSYKVTVTEPVGENMVTEDFNDANFGAESTLKYVDGKLAKWEYQNARRRYTAGYDFDTLQNGSHATWLNYNEEAHFATTKEMEGGIKRVSFLWNRASKDDRIVEFVLSTGAELQSKDTFTKAINDPVMRNIPDFVYNHNVFAKENSKLSIKGTGKKAGKECYLFFGDINVIPYLLYTKKTDTINVLDYKDTPYINKDTIDNTDGGEITYSILTENADDIATINTSTGELTIKGGGTITVQAAWNENKVKTTYTLVINKAEYTPAFAETTVPKTMNDSAFTIALNNVLSTGARTYSSTDERVAKVNNSGFVSIQGPGTTKIKVEIAADGVYKKANAEYTLNVTEPTTETYVTEGFTGLIWGLTSTDPLNGDLGTWTTYYTRRQNTSDSIMSKDKKVGAEWMSGSEKGYLVSNAAIEGGVKRIYMTWVKTAPTQGQESKFLVQVGEVKDTFDCKEITNGTYLHNFNIRENSVIKVANASTNNFRAGPIVITPYIFYLKKNDTIMASKFVYPTVYKQALIDNTNGVGTIIIESDNTEAAEVLTGGDIKIKKAAENPVTITAKWQPDESVEKYVTTSYKLYISDRKQREATFAQPSVTVARGETPVNALDLQSPSGDSEPVVVYESSDTEVAVIGDGNAVLTVGPGTATITAHIGETNKCLAQDVSYALTVTYAPADGTYFTETFSQAVASGYKQGPDTITGTNGVYEWELKRYRRSSSDMVGEQQGIRICYDEKKSNAYLATVGAQEGGVKEVVFDYSVPGSADNVIHFYVQAGDSIHNFHHAPITTGGVAFPYAHDFSQKSNVKLSIMVDTVETPAQAAINVAPVKVVPYLLYTRKDTTVYAKDCENFEFINDSLIDNTNSEGTITYSVPDDNGVASINGATGKITILGEGDVTVTATWKPSSESEDVVTTTYQLHIVLETTTLTFAEKEVVKQLKTTQDTYQQQATLSPEAAGTVTYSIVEETTDASVDADGIVTYTATGTYTIKATFAQQLPYKASEDTYTLTVNSLPTPTIEFNDVNKTMNDAPFINPMKETLIGLGTAHYTTNNAAVATVVEGTGEVTIVGEGTATISVHFDEGTAYAEGDGSYTLTVTDPMEDAVTENFKDATLPAKEIPQTTVGQLATWEYQFARRRYSGTNMPDTLVGGAHATWFNVRDTAYIKTTNVMEGGIKRVSFKWNKQSPNTRTAKFYINAGETQDVVEKVITAGKDVRQVNPNFEYNHNFFVKKNVAFSIYNTEQTSAVQSYILVGDIKITPYLYYTTKSDTLDLKDGNTFKMVPQIDNRDDEVAITYSFVEENVDFAEIDSSTGEIKATASGKVTVKASWGDVYTTYTLIILADKTTIVLMRNDGTNDADTIVNNRGEVAPTITLPTREGYILNAYFTTPKSEDGYRLSVTLGNGSTVWVSNRTINNEKVTGENRIWIYTGSKYTLYAEWKPNDTITLDNQGATEAGTEQVITAYCPNNNTTQLTKAIIVPTKFGYDFAGYYTAANGKGSQLIDATGAFKASVSGYTDKDKWFIKDADITLYAYWTEATEITLNEEDDNSGLISAVAGKTVTANLTRTLAAGKFNTFCVPFDVDKDQLEEVLGSGNITRLATLDEDANATLDDSHKNLNIVIKDAESIEAGKPYLLWLENEVMNPTFTNVTISTTKDSIVSSDKKVTFYGITSPKTIGAKEKSILFVSNNNLKWNGTGKDSDMKGLRAYFEVPGMNSGSGVAARLVMRQPSAPTELMNVNANVNANKVLINDRIYIIRDGVYYDLNGQIVK